MPNFKERKRPEALEPNTFAAWSSESYVEYGKLYDDVPVDEVTLELFKRKIENDPEFRKRAQVLAWLLKHQTEIP